MKTHQILIIENHTIVREGLRQLLAADPNLEIVAEAADGVDALEMFNQYRPDTVLVDLGLPRINGIDVIRTIKQSNPDTRIITLTAHDSEEYIRASFDAGASGYVLKESCHSELLQAIRTVHRDMIYICPMLSGVIVNGYLTGGNSRVGTRGDKLTDREQQILKLIAEGLRNKDISEVLYISCKTVEKHRANLMRKLDLHNASELTTYYLNNTPSGTGQRQLSRNSRFSQADSPSHGAIEGR